MKQKRTQRRRLGTELDVALLLGVTVDGLRNARCTGRGDLATLPWFKFGNGRSAPIRYDLAYIEDVWLEQRRRSHGEPTAT
jgi:hypothetical protein